MVHWPSIEFIAKEDLPERVSTFTSIAELVDRV
jgi:hypothetical protein